MRKKAQKSRNKVRLADRGFLPPVPGLYFVYWKGSDHPDQPIYIGKSRNIRERWGNNFGRGPHHHLAYLRNRDRPDLPVWIKARPLKASFWLDARLQHAEAKAIARHEARYRDIPKLNVCRESAVWWLAIIDFVQLWALCFGCLLLLAAIVSR